MTDVGNFKKRKKKKKQKKQTGKQNNNERGGKKKKKKFVGRQDATDTFYLGTSLMSSELYFLNRTHSVLKENFIPFRTGKILGISRK